MPIIASRSSMPRSAFLNKDFPFVERLVEFLNSFVLKLLGYLIDVDSQFRQLREHPAGFLELLFKPGFRLSVVAVVLLCHITHHSAVCMQSQWMLAFAGA
jgi:hypothetical protein